MSQQCKAGREREHSIIPNTPTPHNQLMEVRRENRRKQNETKSLHIAAHVHLSVNRNAVVENRKILSLKFFSNL